ncbi:MAG TPA: hypothetical protein ENN73_01215 [Firmicutes bacterium]|nr:hypothetical protein [Bacillota bacterium]
MNRLKYRSFFLDLLRKIYLEEFPEKIQIPFSDSDFIREAGREGILNYIYHNLIKKQGVLMLSPESVKKIDEYFFMISARNLRMQKELLTIVKGARETGVHDYLVVKGIHLINLIYKDLGTRPMSDIDIIYSPSALEKLKQVFLDNGYLFGKDSADGCHFKKDDQVIFDLREFEGDFYIGSLREKLSTITYNTLKEFRTEIILEGTPIPVLEPEINLLLFSDHMRKHYFNRLIWFLDFLLVCKAFKVDMNRIEKTAERLNLKKALDYTLYLFSEYLPWSGITPPCDLKWIERSFLKGIFEDRIKKGNTYLYFFALKGPVNKLILVIRKFFPPMREMRYIYKTENNLKLFLYYFIRPFSVLSSFILNILKTRGAV